MNVQVFEKLPGTTPMYETIFMGKLPENAIETVEGWFQGGTPPECCRQTLGEKIVCQVMGEADEMPRYYTVSRNGSEKLSHFSINAVLPMKGVRMLVVEPGKEPREAIVGDDLRALQKAVGGFIECIYPFEDDVLIIDNEEGKLIGLEGNRRIENDIIAGTFLIAADDGEGGFKNLTPEQVETYTEKFRKPEMINKEDIENVCGFTFVDI